MDLFVNEIFNSISGETGGPNFPQGIPCTFIRLQGCNLQPPCKWCDTPNAQDPETGRLISIDDIVEMCCDRVLITGGEPLLQEFSLTILTRKLVNNHIQVQIETNGSKLPFSSPFGIDWVIDYKLGSSGQTNKMMSPTTFYLMLKNGHNHFVKFVFANWTDVEEAFALINGWMDKGLPVKKWPYIIFSPLDGGDSEATKHHCQRIVEMIHDKELQTYCVLSVQIHKILGLK